MTASSSRSVQWNAFAKASRRDSLCRFRPIVFLQQRQTMFACSLIQAHLHAYAGDALFVRSSRDEDSAPLWRGFDKITNLLDVFGNGLARPATWSVE